jgi:hypothetical protein
MFIEVHCYKMTTLKGSHKFVRETRSPLLPKKYLRQSQGTAPETLARAEIVYDSAQSISNSAGNCELSFRNVPFDETCFLKVLHRNSVETWTAIPIGFSWIQTFAPSFSKSSLI